MTTYRDSITFDISAGPGAYKHPASLGDWEPVDTRLHLQGVEGTPPGSTVAELELWFQPGQDMYEPGVSIELTDGDCLDLAHALMRIAVPRDESANVTRAPFDAFEVSQVGDFQDAHGDHYVERLNPGDKPWDDNPEYVAAFYTVYGHRSFPDQGKAPSIEGQAADGSGYFVNGIEVTKAYYDERQAWLTEISKDTTGYGATAIADFEGVAEARDLAYALANGLPVNDYTEGS